MNIKNRLQKLETATLPDADLCQCPDSTAYMATEYARLCHQCGKRIDIKTWKHWDVIYPTLETDCFAFALRRNEVSQ